MGHFLYSYGFKKIHVFLETIFFNYFLCAIKFGPAKKEVTSLG